MLLLLRKTSIVCFAICYLDVNLCTILQEDLHATILPDLQDLRHGQGPVAGVVGGPRHHLVDTVILRVQL